MAKTQTPPNKALAPAPDLAPARSTVGQVLVALAASVLLAVVYTWQALTRLTHGVVGGDLDGYENMWNFWWVKTALFDLNRSPFFTEYLYYPTGISLRFHTLNPLNGLLTLPFNQTLGYIPTFNLFLAATLTATLFCAFLLIRDIVGNPWAAFAGAAVYTYASEHTLIFFTLGQTEKLSLQWLPLYFFFLFRALHGRPVWSAEDRLLRQDTRQRALYAAFAVAALVAMSLTDWQYVMLAVFATALYAVFLLFTRRAPRDKAVLWGWLGLVGVAYAAIVAVPLLIPMVREMQSSPWLIVSGQSVFRALALDSLLGFGTGNPGYLAFAAAAVGLWAAWRARDPAREIAVFSAALALIFYVMALGPNLVWNGNTTGIPLPYSLLQSIPVLNVGRDPGRYSTVALLGISVLVALCIRSLLVRIERRSRARWIPTALVTLFVAATVAPFVARAWAETRLDPPDFPEFYREIATGTGGYALLELPLFTEEGRGENHYMMYQVLHEKHRFSGRWARDHALDNPDNFVKTTPLLRDLWMAAQPEARRGHFYPERDIIPAPDYAATGAPLLNMLRVPYIVLYKDAISPELHEEFDPLLTTVLGPDPVPYRDEPLITVYRVPERPAPPQPFAMAVGNGWYPAAENPSGRVYRWADNATLIPGTSEPAYPRSELYVANVSPEPVRAVLRFTAYSFAVPRALFVRLDLIEHSRLELDPAQPERETIVELTVPPGSHTITFESPEPARPTGDPNDARLLTFGMYGVTLEPAP